MEGQPKEQRLGFAGESLKGLLNKNLDPCPIDPLLPAQPNGQEGRTGRQQDLTLCGRKKVKQARSQSIFASSLSQILPNPADEALNSPFLTTREPLFFLDDVDTASYHAFPAISRLVCSPVARPDSPPRLCIYGCFLTSFDLYSSAPSLIFHDQRSHLTTVQRGCLFASCTASPRPRKLAVALLRTTRRSHLQAATSRLRLRLPQRTLCQ
ncbi:hypothetical protein CGCF415_v001042 [Colletotrichum fructicola]|uniref:Uncharacterized protein n=1 Tax=Colletotrichum fructicola (strain Nara gc5) TaxID=1213859 RepID=A0A7J6JD59_COLFN|nr:hypothetical protein CFRS1_v012044 [Colletotrichum fructicola]KAF4488246.1 hypothetical protein CGGC5_v003950 [Colletotrichum fructicola Nara gc5]KAF4901330.1 hypothetical protein CGCFRS4_v002812 [Colletotrichum fructicola]KAF4916061.1 hypothetical protein CGCF415_v001042 [Colletotrichum fructicola]KAF4941731.1 hypothetical protein CGCF245_v001335 [Colletotrichum fructicola]